MGVDEDIGKMLSGIKSGSLSGLPVICAKTGKKMGVIVDIVFKPDEEFKITEDWVRNEMKAKGIPVDRMKNMYMDDWVELDD